MLVKNGMQGIKGLTMKLRSFVGTGADSKFCSLAYKKARSENTRPCRGDCLCEDPTISWSKGAACQCENPPEHGSYSLPHVAVGSSETYFDICIDFPTSA